MFARFIREKWVARLASNQSAQPVTSPGVIPSDAKNPIQPSADRRRHKVDDEPGCT
jgi:hypothetical protein